MNQPVSHLSFRPNNSGKACGLLLICMLVMLVALAARAQSYAVLHSFTGGLDGLRPSAGLTLLGTGNLFGGAGPTAMFRLRQTGNGWVFTPIFEFNGTDGESLVGRLSVGPDGALYGATSGGGLQGCMGFD